MSLINRLRGGAVLVIGLAVATARADDIDDAVSGMVDAAGQLLAMKHYSEAEHAYRSALNYRPKDAQALKGLADTLAAEGKSQEAAGYYARLGGGAAARPAPAAAAQTPPPTPAAQTPEAVPPPPLPADAPPPPIPTAAAPLPAAAPAAPVQLTPPANVGRPLGGWCGYVSVGPQGSVFANFLYFNKQGYIYTGPPMGDTNFNEAARRDPDHTGTYTYDGQTLSITYANGKNETHRFDNSACDGNPMQEAGLIKAGTILDGVYSHSMNAMSFGGVTVMAGGTWKFHSDGTFEHTDFASTETTGTHHEANALGAGSALTSGRYTITDGKLSLNNGAETHIMGYISDKTPPWYITIDGETFKLD